MPSSYASDFLQNYIALASMLAQRDAQRQNAELQRQTLRANNLQMLANITSGIPDRGAAWDFLESQSQETGIGLDPLLALARGQAPTETSIRAGAAARGRAAQTPEQASAQDAEAASITTTGQPGFQNAIGQFLTGQLGRMTAGGPNQPVANMLGEAAILRQLTNMTPSQFSIDQATHNFDPEQIRQSAMIQASLMLSPFQQESLAVQREATQAQTAVGMANNRLGWAELIQRGELGMLGHQLEMLKIQAGSGQGLTLAQAGDIAGMIGGLTEALQKPGNAATKQIYSGLIDVGMRTLNQAGYSTPAVDPNELTRRMGNPWGPNVRRWNDTEPPFGYIVPGTPQPAAPAPLLGPAAAPWQNVVRPFGSF